jgi:hypothetical protein
MESSNCMTEHEVTTIVYVDNYLADERGAGVEKKALEGRLNKNNNKKSSDPFGIAACYSNEVG